MTGAIEIMAFCGMLCIIFRGVPQVFYCVRAGNAYGISIWFLILWLVGTLLLMPQMIMLKSWYVLSTYVFNLVAIAIIMKYKIKPRGKQLDKILNGANTDEDQ